jgi:uncharacterized membrane protein
MKFLTENYITRGFWGDESWTALISQRPIPEMLRVTGEDFHPPLYYLLVHWWGSLFGFSEFGIRSLSLLFFSLIQAVTYLMTSFLGLDKRYRMMVVTLTLLSPILFTYAFEARAYTLLTFLSVASSYAFWQIRTLPDAQKKWSIIYLILAALSVYAHYYAWFILASHAVYAVIFERHLIPKLWWVGVGVLIAQLPWLPVLFSQVKTVNQSYWIGAMNSKTHLEFFYRVSAGDITLPMQMITAGFIAAIIVFGIASRLVQKPTKSKKTKVWSPFYIFLWTWLLVPTLIPTLISLHTPVFFYRYLIFSIVPLLMLTVDGLSRTHKYVGYLLFVGLIGCYLNLTWMRFIQYPNTMRQEIAKLYQTKQAGDGPIYTVLPSFAEVMYYAGNSDDIRVKPEGIIQASGKSLLDSFVRSGDIIITEPPKDQPYWEVLPGPTHSYIEPTPSPLPIHESSIP